MGNLEDALKKAGLAPEEEAAAAAAEAAAAPAEGGAATSAPAGDAAPAAPVELKETPCAQCGTPFMPKHPRHRMCDKCAGERAAARKSAPKPEGKVEGTRDRAAASLASETRACARCGTVFTPKHPRHRMCDKCAAEAPREPRPPREAREVRPPREPRPASAEPRSAPESHPAPAASRPAPRPPRREAPPMRDRTLPTGVPNNYLSGGYFSGQNRTSPRDELYLGWAEQWAELLVYRRLSAGQLRAFYNHVRRAAAALQAGAEAQAARSQVLRLSGFAAARVGRPGFPQEFREFLDRNIEQVKDADSLKAFAEHFQAVVGYTAGRLRN